MKKLFANELCEKAVARIASGDLSALSVLYECVGRLLFSISFAILGDYQLAEDAVQDTLLQIAEKAKTYQKGSNAKAWIAAVCRNIALKKLSGKNREFPVEDEALTSGVSSEFESTLEFESILSVLSAEEKEIVVLKIIWGLKHSEIARMLNISTENSRQKYKRALYKLKKDYTKEVSAYE